MTPRIFGCKRFRRLVAEQDDRQLSPLEVNFLDRHRLVCNACCHSERQFAAALNMLRSATLEADTRPMFEDRVIRRLRLNLARDGFEYWSPAILGASVACVAIFAAMQLISRSSELPQLSAPRGEAMRILPQDDYPTLLLDRSAHSPRHP